LKTTTNPVYIVATAPSIGQSLIAVSATQATWQTPALVTTTQSGFMSFGDKIILDNITSSTQSLTNKTIIGTTNYVETNALKTTTNPVLIVATAPSIGQSLIAVSATQATWQTPQSASSQKTPVDPATTSSNVGVMMGLSASITPVLTGKIMIIISGDMDNSSGDDGAQVQMRTGTGTPPINGAALTGTTQGGLVKMSVVTSGAGDSVTRVPFSLNAIVTGLTLNTAVWVDISLAAIGGGTARVRDISISVVEL
jgi:F0F1-type ATP synthase membrane subunit c/vacuolar-type H+-ATPase subunit K